MPNQPLLPKITPDNVLAAIAIGATTYSALAQVFGIEPDGPIAENAAALVLGNTITYLERSRAIEMVPGCLDAYRVALPVRLALGLPVTGSEA